MADYLISSALDAGGKPFAVVCHKPTKQLWVGRFETCFAAVNLLSPSEAWLASSKKAFTKDIVKIFAIASGVLLQDFYRNLNFVEFIHYSEGKLAIKPSSEVLPLVSEILDFYVQDDLVLFVDTSYNLYKTSIADLIRKKAPRLIMKIRDSPDLVCIQDIQVLAIGPIDVETNTQSTLLLATFSAESRKLLWVPFPLDEQRAKSSARKQRAILPVNFSGGVRQAAFPSSDKAVILTDQGKIFMIINIDCEFVIASVQFKGPLETDNIILAFAAHKERVSLLSSRNWCEINSREDIEQKIKTRTCTKVSTVQMGILEIDSKKVIYDEPMLMAKLPNLESDPIVSASYVFVASQSRLYSTVFFLITQSGRLLQLYAEKSYDAALGNIIEKVNSKSLLAFSPFSQKPKNVEEFWLYLSRCVPSDMLDQTQKFYNAFLLKQSLSSVPGANIQSLMDAYYNRIQSCRGFSYNDYLGLIFMLLERIVYFEKNKNLDSQRPQELLKELQMAEANCYGRSNSALPIEDGFAEAILKHYFQIAVPDFFWNALKVILQHKTFSRIMNVYETYTVKFTPSQSAAEEIHETAFVEFSKSESDTIQQEVANILRTAAPPQTACCNALLQLINLLLAITESGTDEFSKEERMQSAWVRLRNAEWKFYSTYIKNLSPEQEVFNGIASSLKKRAFPGYYQPNDFWIHLQNMLPEQWSIVQRHYASARQIVFAIEQPTDIQRKFSAAEMLQALTSKLDAKKPATVEFGNCVKLLTSLLQVIEIIYRGGSLAVALEQLRIAECQFHSVAKVENGLAEGLTWKASVSSVAVSS